MQPEIETNKIVATYERHSSAEDAIRRLSEAGFDLKHITVVGVDYHTEERPVGFVNTGDRMRALGTLGLFWGSVWGILFGSAMLFVPGVGHVIVGGWLASTIAGFLEGAVIGGSVGAIGGAIAGIGIPHNSVIAFEADLRAGKFVLAARGTAEEIQLAENILRGTGPERLVVSSETAELAEA